MAVWVQPSFTSNSRVVIRGLSFAKASNASMSQSTRRPDRSRSSRDLSPERNRSNQNWHVFCKGALSQYSTDNMSSKGRIVAELELVKHTVTNIRRNHRLC